MSYVDQSETMTPAQRIAAGIKRIVRPVESPSLLDDARKLAAPCEPTYFDDHDTDLCSFCQSSEGRWSGQPGASPWYIEHREGCPILAMPRIVAVIEAAERMVAFDDGRGPSKVEYEDPVCAFCSGDLDYGDGGSHKPDCPWQALVAALKWSHHLPVDNGTNLTRY